MRLTLKQKISAILSATIIVFFFNNCAEPSHSVYEMNSMGPSATSADSIAIFESTLHPVLINQCGSCHGSSQSPLFAVNNAGSAHATIISMGLVSLSSPSSSRLVQKILGGHQGKSSAVATEIQTQIQAWADGLAANGGPIDLPPPTPLEPTFASISEKILQPKCVACHGATMAKGGSRYDTYAYTMKDVNTLVPKESELYKEVVEGKMPPDSPLSNEEINVILQWISMGAPNN